VNFFSRQHARFSRDDLPVAQRIAGHLALVLWHERLAVEARQRQVLEARAAALELLDQSLASLTDTGPLVEHVTRISAVTRSVLAHDALALPVLLPDGRRARRYASSGLDVGRAPDEFDVPAGFLSDPSWEYDVIDDATTRDEPQNRLAANQGFRSVLRVPVRLEGRLMGAVTFLSRTPSLYKQSDVQAARRVAGRIAQSLEREHGLEEGKRADAATERAARLESRVQALTDELDARTGYRRVIGHSASWKHVLTQATQVAETETTVLLLGESGTGKEVVGRFLHRASRHRDGPFVALNCAALPEHLLEAELFGYERGAFTGAVQSKPGQLEQAAGGTLFLDEIGEMSLPAQAKFLRVLQEREFQRLGGTRVLKTNARVVGATNRDLHKAMAQGTFREDLYYRLAVFAIRLPALRERRDDVLTLSEAFLKEFGRTLGRPPAGISTDARARLVAYHWPGNVRELRNVLERAAILCDGGLITADLLALMPPVNESSDQLHPDVGSTAASASAGKLSSMERTMIEQALRDARNNKSKAAKTLGLTRAQLYVRMRRYGLE
jgi:two-component system response regulator AtoC